MKKKRAYPDTGPLVPKSAKGQGHLPLWTSNGEGEGRDRWLRPWKPVLATPVTCAYPNLHHSTAYAAMREQTAAQATSSHAERWFSLLQLWLPSRHHGDQEDEDQAPPHQQMGGVSEKHKMTKKEVISRMLSELKRWAKRRGSGRSPTRGRSEDLVMEERRLLQLAAFAQWIHGYESYGREA